MADCQHRLIDNQSRECVECGAGMVGRTARAETVFVEGANPPEQVVAYSVAYQCDRCREGGCAGVHEGERMRVDELAMIDER